jgi:hypothetical protein
MSISTSQIVFIDSGVSDYQTLAQGVIADLPVIILDRDRDGIEQVTNILKQKTYSTVHIVSHGSPGCLHLGNTQLSLDTLDKYQEELQNWFVPIPPFSRGRGDLLIYGCNVSTGDAGKEFITKLRNLTGAEIAASTTRIGNAAKGGNWELDYRTTEINAELAFDRHTKQNYAGVFAEEDKNLLVSNLTEDLSKEITSDIASVTTDLDDYPPGATAIVTGENFELGETIELQVLHTDGVPNTGGGHEPWQVTDGGEGDLDGVVDGNFETTWYVNPDDSFKSAFEITATGLSSKEVATNTFTDGIITVNGTAFIDYNNDGIQQTGNSAAEVGLSGITVKAYDSAGTQVASTTTNSSGAYSFTSGTATTTVPLRVEFGNLPSGYFEGKSSKSVFFADGTSNVTQNLGLLDPDKYIATTPNLITSCFALGSYSGKTDTAIVSVLHNASGGSPTKTSKATIGNIGTVYGLAYQKQTGDIFAAAFQKRFSDVVGTNGNSKIYRINSSGTASTFINLDNFFGSNSAGAYAHSANIGTIDASSFDKVSKVAFGDMDISEDRKYLWTINLADRRLYKIQVGSNSDPTNPVNYLAGDTRTISRYNIVSTLNSDNSGITGFARASDIRPFAVAEKDGLVYIGMVDSAQSTGTASDLRAYVYTFNPTTATFSSSPVLNFALNYTRENKVDFPSPKQPATWDPWTDTHGGTNGSTGLNFQQEGTSTKYWALRTQPIFSDIEFDNNGNIIVGLRDRTGDQTGDQSLDLTGAGNYNTGSGGDILKASLTGTNQWTIETGATDTNASTEFYGGEEYGIGGNYQHYETAQGGLTQVPGYTSIDTTALDPLDFNTGGIIGLNHTNGTQTRGIQLYSGGFAKANGLGDLEYLGEVAPIEIGNRIWTDADNDGIQDAGESGISGVTVNLYNSSGTQVGTTTTNSSGEYYFNSGLLPNTSYTIRLNYSNISISPANVGSNDEIDSDAVISGGFPTIAITTGDYGVNNHSYDFGVIADYGDAPDTSSSNVAGDYSTTATNNGASHFIVSDLSIGSSVDGDTGTLQNAAATADDTSNTGAADDEDGVTITNFKTDDGTYSVTVNVNNTLGAGSNAKLVGWIDFDQSGTFDADEAQIISNISASGNQILTWNPLVADTKAGTTYARFRLSTDAALTTSYSTGAASNGEVEDYQVTVTGVDYGDAPDTGTGTAADNYKTTKADGGASHTIVSGLSIGSSVDADLGNLQNPTATADDGNGTDDEDGVTVSAIRTDDGTYSVTVSVNNTTGTAANLLGWIDFNGDGIFQSIEAANSIQTVAANSGSTSTTLSWAIPSNIQTGTTFARFRLSTDPLTNASAIGALGNGEVEDYQLDIAGVDYGDAPDTGAGTGNGNYETTNKTGTADDGASHGIVTGLTIGSSVDADNGTLENAAADADGADEDGITTFNTLATNANSYSVEVEVTNTLTPGTDATLVGWIDFDRDGLFSADEAATATVANGATSAILDWNAIPDDITAGLSYARFRLSTDPLLTTSYSTGAANNGEVEDYQINIKNTITGTGGSETLTNSTVGVDDLFIGGAGQDKLTGNGGNDCFKFNRTSDGIDIITDFNSGDKIDLSSLFAAGGELAGITNPLGTYVETVSAGSGTLIQVDFGDDGNTTYNKNVVYLENYTTAMTAADFIF